MDAVRDLNILWAYLVETFPRTPLKAVFEEFERDIGEFDIIPEANLSDKEAQSLLFDLGYVAVEGLFGGDFDTWYEVLHYTLQFDNETIAFLDF